MNRIREKGLVLQPPGNICRSPRVVSDSPAEIGCADVLFRVKGYHLQAFAKAAVLYAIIKLFNSS